MERVRRLRAFVYAAIAFAVLLCAALFSLSYAKWDVGGATSSATTSGTVGLFYVDYPQPVMETVPPAKLADNIDDSEPDSIVLQFKKDADDPTLITVKFKFTGVTENLFAHIWCNTVTGFASTTWKSLYLSNNGATKKASIRSETAKIAWSQLTGFIIARGTTDVAQSGDKDIQSKISLLQDNYIYTIPLTQSGGTLSVGSVSATEYAEQTDAPAIKYGEASKTVRHVKANGTSIYKNYVCVSREYEYAEDGTLTATSGAPTSAYVDFSVAGDDLSATVETFTVSRAFVGDDGVPTGAQSQMRVYGSPEGKTLADINNAYVILDFAGGAARYCAMDITIVTVSNVTFELTATAAYTKTSAPIETNKFYLYTNNGSGGLPVEMSRSLGASKTIDQSVMLTLSENTMFKMFKAANADSLDGATWYSPASNSTVDCPQSGITASMVTAASSDYGNIKLINPAGKYLVRYTADEDAAYDKVSVQMIAVERCDGLGSEVQAPEDGYYVVGSFSEFKLYDGCKMTPDANMEGYYEYTLPAATKYMPVYAVAHVSDGEIAYSALNAAVNGAKICYDSFADEMTDGAAKPLYRFVADVSDTDAYTQNMTLGYRYAIDGLKIQKPDDVGITDVGDVSEYDAVNGLQFETGKFKAAADGSGLFYVDIADESIVDKVSNLNIRVAAGTHGNIVSVTVHSGSGVNSFNINRYTIDGFTSYDRGHSYRITADGTKPTVSGGEWQPADFHNFTGTLQRFSDGELGERKPFGLGNAGYAIVRADGMVVELDRTSGSTTHPYIAEYEKTDGTARTFTVFVNGNAKSLANDDDIPRIRKIDGYPYEFGTPASEKAKGFYKFNIGDNNINITFSTLDTNNLTEIVGVDKNAAGTSKYTPDKLWKSEYDAYENGYFVFGQFTRWAVYPEFAMTASPDMAGYYSYTNESIITVADTTGANAIATTADKYKIVYLDKTVYNGNTYAQFTYIGDGGDTSMGAPNITATDTSIYYDTFTGKPTTVKPTDFYRIIYGTTSMTGWGAFSDYRIYYWNGSKNNGWSNRGTAMNTSVSGKIYYDISAAEYAALTGAIVFFKENNSAQFATQTAAPSDGYKRGNSYLIEMTGYDTEAYDDVLKCTLKRSTATCVKFV